jgi:hypothetical protein
MQNDKTKSMEAIRKMVHTHLMSLTPEEAKALRTRFGIERRKDADDGDLRALAGELARLKKKST